MIVNLRNAHINYITFQGGFNMFLQILIYNYIGEKVKSFPLESGQTKFEIDLATLPKGIFFYRIFKNGVVLETRKIIKDQVDSLVRRLLPT